MPKTVTLQGKIITDSLKVKDTLISITVPQSTATNQNQSFWDLGVVKIGVPVLVSLLLVMINNKVANFNKKRDKRTFLESKKITIQTWGKKVIKLSNQVQVNINSLKHDLIKETGLSIANLYHTTTLADKIKTLDLAEYTSYTITNLEGETEINSNNSALLLYDIEFINRIQTDLFENHTNYNNQIRILIDDWNNSNSDLMLVTTRMMNEVRSKPYHIGKKFVDKIYELTKYNKGYTNLLLWNQNFCVPVFAAIYDELENKPDNQFPSELLVIMNKLRIVYIQYNFLKKNYIEELTFISENHLEVLDDLSLQIKTLTEKNLKPINYLT